MNVMPRDVFKYGVQMWLVLLFCFSGARHAWSQDLPPREELTFYSQAYTRYEEVKARTIQMRQEADLAGLEALAAELRASKESMMIGTWQLSNFYDFAVEIPRESLAEADEAMKFYERWAAERPTSITAQLCLADAYTSYAWAARGSGWASTVTDEGQRLMDERLEKAWEVLKKARQLDEQCPQWTVIAQTVALGQGWDYDTYFKMVEEAIRREPSYGAYYKTTCQWLLPRWYGEEGDFERWIAEKADEHPEKDKQYARLVWQADALGWKEEMVFAKDRLDWERVKRGFTIWLQESPESLPLRFEYIRLALLADDRVTAREQFEVTGGKYWPPIWNGKPERFEMARKFAYSNGANPLRLPVAKASAQSGKFQKVAHWLGHLSHALGGLLAGGLCLTLALQRKRGWLGGLMLVVCVVLAVLYGTIAAAIPSFVFALYLWTKDPVDAVEKPPQSWGITLLWIVLVMGLVLVTQILATMLAMAFELATGNFKADEIAELTNHLFASGQGFLIIVNTQWLGLLLLLVACGRQSMQSLRSYLGMVPTSWLRAVPYLVAGAVLITASSFGAGQFQDEKTKISLKMMAAGLQSPWVFFLALVVLAPVSEELLMRGYAFHGWLPKFGFYGTALLSSLIFALSHIQYGWAGLLNIFIMGCILAWVRWKTGSIYPSILLHGLNNLAYFLSILLSQPA